MRLLIIALCLICLTGCNFNYFRETSQGGKQHTCTVKKDHPMREATYCEWNYAQGYAEGLEYEN